jgi:phage protein D/phage baseplate assembly protein gpV
MPHKYLSHFDIKIGGQNMSADFYDDLDEVAVDTSLQMASMFTIKLRDQDLKWVDDASLDIGKEVEIGVELDENSESSKQSDQLIKGEITALEPVFSPSGLSYMCVRGYDKSHRLHLGRKTRTFLKNTDSGLASTIAGECGLTADVDATPITHDYIIQFNQTNMEFLLSRANRIGYKVYAQNGKLCFKKNTNLPSTSSVTLEYGENLLSFEPRWTTSHQANQATVKGWDAANKQAINQTIATNDGMKQGGLTSAPGSVVSSKFQSASEVVVSYPIATVDEANQFAQMAINDLGLQLVQAEGVCFGDPGVQAGNKIEVKGVGTRFSGYYLVTSALHVYTRDGYRTYFYISGRHPQTLARLVGADDQRGTSFPEIAGVVVGLVTNLSDPLNIGRVKVKFPWLSDEVESDWIRVASPMAGAQRGFLFMPEVNDEVLITFEHGDPHRPYIIGALWNSKDKPPYPNTEEVVGGKVEKRILKTRAGHILEFIDKSGEEKVTIKTKAGHIFVMDDKSGSENVSITDKSGNKLVIDSVKKSMSIDVGGDFNVTSKGKINLKSTGNIDIAASAGNATVKGIKLALEGTGSSELKGATVKVSATAQAELTAAAMVKLQGGIVKIN